MPQLDLDGYQLNYQDVGTGEVLLLIHGFPLDNRVWDGVIQTVSKTHRVIAPDLRGFGQNKYSEAFTMTQLADDLMELIQSLEIAGCTAAGLSMGGYVLQELVYFDHRMLKHLILVDTKADADTPEGKTKRDVMASTAINEGSKAIADMMFPNMLAPTHDPEIGARLRQIMELQHPQTLASACAAMRDRRDYNEMLAGLKVPVSLIVGKYDAITPPTLAQALAEKLWDGKVIEIAGAGHMAPLEQPQAVADAILQLIGEVE